MVYFPLIRDNKSFFLLFLNYTFIVMWINGNKSESIMQEFGLYEFRIIFSKGDINLMESAYQVTSVWRQHFIIFSRWVCSVKVKWKSFYILADTERTKTLIMVFSNSFLVKCSVYVAVGGLTSVMIMRSILMDKVRRQEYFQSALKITRSHEGLLKSISTGVENLFWFDCRRQIYSWWTDKRSRHRSRRTECL